MKSLQDGDPRKIGRYTILGVLGEGGMGRVYLGVFGKDNQRQYAAVKVMASRFADNYEFRNRFEREIRTATRVKGYFTAAVLDYGILKNNALWFASEYIPGKTLAEAIQTSSFVGDSLVYLAWSLYYALVVIHNEGIVHRDLKPQNIILSEQGLRVIDFGVAYVIGESAITATGEMIGTPHYMAPEQILGEAPHPAWDIFALGSMLVYASTGHHAFGKENTSPIVICEAVRTQPPNLDGVPPLIRKLVAECLKKDPKKRIALEQIEKFLPPLNAPLTTLRCSEWMPTAVTAQISDITRAVPRREQAKRSGSAPQAQRPTGLQGTPQQTRNAQPREPRQSQPAQKKPAGQSQKDKDQRSGNSLLQIIVIIAAIVVVLAIANSCGLLDRASDSSKSNSAAPFAKQTLSQSYAFETDNDSSLEQSTLYAISSKMHFA